MLKSKANKAIFSAIAGVLVILALLWYFQEQGLVKVFPTSEEREVKKILEIDESRFALADGLDESVFQQRIELLYQQRDAVLADPENAQPWFIYGNTLEFLNDHESAIAAWKKTLEFQPQNFAAATNIATNYQYFIRDFEQAEEYYLKALEGNREYTPAYQGLIDLYWYNLKSAEQLEAILLVAVQNDSSNAAPYFATLVDYFATDGGDLQKARAYLQEVQRHDPDKASDLRETYPNL